MKRTYIKGCEWCNATGFVPTENFGMGTTPMTDICPVCKGNKVVEVTEYFDQQDVNFDNQNEEGK